MRVFRPTPGAPMRMMGRHRLESGSNLVTCSYVGISSPIPRISTYRRRESACIAMGGEGGAGGWSHV